MKMFTRIFVTLACTLFTIPLFAGEMPSLEETLDMNWARYNAVFRSPRDLFFEIKTELKDKDEALRLEETVKMLRSVPTVEEAFVVIPRPIWEQERTTIFRLINAPPVEFGAWLEKLQPAHVREEIRHFIKCTKSGTRNPGECCPCASDPLGLKNFAALPGNTPIFKQLVPIGIYVRLRANASADQNPWQWREQASSLEQEIRREYDRMGWIPIIIRYQYIPPSTPMAEPLLISFWLAVSLVGTGTFFCFFRRISPFLGLLGLLVVVYLLLGWLAPLLPHFIHPLLLPAALSLTLFWALLIFFRANSGQTTEAFQDTQRHLIAFLCPGALGLLLFEFARFNAYPSLGLFLVAVPLGLTGIAFLLRAGWGHSDGGDSPTPLFSTGLGFLSRRKKTIMVLLMIALTIPLTLKKVSTFAQEPLRRPPTERVWSLLPDHAWTDQTVCLLTEGNSWGEIIYQLGAQRFAFTHAKDEHMVSRYWNAAAWVPRPVWQRSNAADFLRKRNVVVIEKIARQEGLPKEDFDAIVDYLNEIGEACLPLTQDEKAEWVLSREPNALGLRFRHWMQAGPDSITVLSYCFVQPPTSQETLMSWIAKAMEPFGVEARWVAPQILEQAAIREMLVRIALIAAICLAAFCFLVRGRQMVSSARSILATFFWPASWLLNLVAWGWNWTGEGLWVWTWVALWHTTLCVGWFTRRRGSPENDSEVLPATIVTGLTVLAMAWLWAKSGKSETYAVLLGTGVFWSLAWCILLAPSSARNSKEQ